MGKSKPEVCVSVNGQDCTGDIKSWTAKDFRALARAFEDAAFAIERKVHGCIDEEGVHIGIDFGGVFDDDNGLPAIDRESLRGRSEEGRGKKKLGEMDARGFTSNRFAVLNHCELREHAGSLPPWWIVRFITAIRAWNSEHPSDPT
jgi:hypothetical protein